MVRNKKNGTAASLHDPAGPQHAALDSEISLLKRRVYDLSQYFTDFRGHARTLIREKVQLAMRGDCNFFPADALLQECQRKVERLEKLLFHDDFETFTAIDRALSTSQTQPEAELSPRRRCVSDPIGSQSKPCDKDSMGVAKQLTWGCEQTPQAEVAAEIGSNSLSAESPSLSGAWATSAGVTCLVVGRHCIFDGRFDDPSVLEQRGEEISVNGYTAASILDGTISWQHVDTEECIEWHRIGGPLFAQRKKFPGRK